MPRNKHIQRVGTYHESGAEDTGHVLVRAGVFAYLTAEADTTLTDADTWYPVAGVFSNDPEVGFTADAGGGEVPPGIVYMGSESCYFEVDWHASYATSKAATVFGGVLLNNVIVPSSVVQSPTFAQAAAGNASGTTVVRLEYGDRLTLAAKSSVAGLTLTLYTLSTSANNFFRSPQ